MVVVKMSRGLRWGLVNKRKRVERAKTINKQKRKRTTTGVMLDGFLLTMVLETTV